MMLKGVLSQLSPYRKFLMLVSISLISAIIFSMIGSGVSYLLWGVNFFSDTTVMTRLDDSNVVSAMKLLQMVSATGMFLIPALFASWLFSANADEYLGAKRKPLMLSVLLLLPLLLAAVPFINFMLLLNENIHLADWLKAVENWMKEAEEQATLLTEAFLTMNSTGDLMLNILMIGILPALGEEFMFRGVIQKLFQQMTKNIHLAILISSVLFSAIHMQFFGFIPRMMLGIFFGYLLVWSGTIWLPVLAHFINNTAAVILAYMRTKGMLSFDENKIGTGEQEMMLMLGSTLIMLLLLLAVYRIEKKHAVHNSSSA